MFFLKTIETARGLNKCQACGTRMKWMGGHYARTCRKCHSTNPEPPTEYEKLVKRSGITFERSEKGKMATPARLAVEQREDGKWKAIKGVLVLTDRRLVFGPKNGVSLPLEQVKAVVDRRATGRRRLFGLHYVLAVEVQEGAVYRFFGVREWAAKVLEQANTDEMKRKRLAWVKQNQPATIDTDV